MKIQINTKDNIQQTDKLVNETQAYIRSAIGRYEERITRIEVHFSDVNSDERSGEDKRCLIEARLAGRQPLVADHLADTVELAVAGAAEKLGRVVSRTIDRENNNR